MNHPTFLTIARQGKNGWKRYLLGILISTGVFVILYLLAFYIVWISFYLAGTSLKINQATTESFLYANPTLYLFLVALTAAFLLLGLFLVMKFVHKRQFMTLISPDSTIDWFRVFKGLIVWLGINGISFSVWYLIVPSRYSLTFNLGEWLPFVAWSLILLPVIVCLRVLLINGYLLQGLGLLIQRPLILTIVWGFLLGSLLTDFKMPSFWIVNVLKAIFVTWITIKDDRLELVIGITMADALFGFFLGSPDPKINLPSVFQVTTSEAPALVVLVTFLLKAGVFYLICFGWRRNLAGASQDITE
jgi:uncharacterized protein